MPEKHVHYSFHFFFARLLNCLKKNMKDAFLNTLQCFTFFLCRATNFQTQRCLDTANSKCSGISKRTNNVD